MLVSLKRIITPRFSKISVYFNRDLLVGSLLERRRRRSERWVRETGSCSGHRQSRGPQQRCGVEYGVEDDRCAVVLNSKHTSMWFDFCKATACDENASASPRNGAETTTLSTEETAVCFRGRCCSDQRIGRARRTGRVAAHAEPRRPSKVSPDGI